MADNYNNYPVGTLFEMRKPKPDENVHDYATFHPRSTVSVAQQKAALEEANRPYADKVAEKRKQAGKFWCAVGDNCLPCVEGTCDSLRDANRYLGKTYEDYTKEGTAYDIQKTACQKYTGEKYADCVNELGKAAQSAKETGVELAGVVKEKMIRTVLPNSLQNVIDANRRYAADSKKNDDAYEKKERDNPPFILNVVDQRPRGMSHAFEARAYTDLRDIKEYLINHGVDGFNYFIINDKHISAGDGDGKLGIQLQDLRVNERNSNIAIRGGMKKTRKRRKKITKRRKMVRRNKRTRRLV